MHKKTWFLVAAFAAITIAALPARAEHHEGMAEEAMPAEASIKVASDHVAEIAVVGQPAPDVTFTDTRGVEHSISGFKGNIVVLEWTNPECPFDKKHYDTGNMQRLQKEATEAGVVWIAVNSGAEGKQGHFATDAEAQAYVTERGANMTAYTRDVSGAFGHAYGAKTTPHMFVIDANGTLAYSGAIDSIPSAQYEDVEKAENYVMAAVKALQAGEAVAVPTTKPYGCSVKY